jgi:hypothetical protein
MNSTHLSRRLFMVVTIVLAVTAGVWALLPRTAHAKPQGNVYIVTRTDDPTGSGTIGNLSLRQAVVYANADPGSTIQLTHGAVYVLSNAALGDLLVTADMTITHDYVFSCFIVACPAAVWQTMVRRS